MRSALLPLCASLAVLAPGAARAGDAAGVGVPRDVRDLGITLEVDPCVSVAPARLGELLRLELTVLTDAGPHAPRPRTRARIACDGPAVVLSVRDDGDATASPGALLGELRLDWADYPPGSRPRLLALALSEMIARRWKEVAPAPAPTPSTTAPATATVAVPAARAPRGSASDAGDARLLKVDLGLLVSAGRLGRPRTTSAGLALGLAWRIRPWLTVYGDGRVDAARFDTSPGTVSARRASAGLAALFGLTRGRLWLGAGPGVRGGWAWLRGQPTRSAPTGLAFDAPWWGPLMTAGVSVRATGHLVVVVNLEAGWVARTVIGEVGTPMPAGAPSETVALERLWLSAAAGIAWHF